MMTGRTSGFIAPVCCAFLLVAGPVAAQTINYPRELAPGERFTAPAAEDTVFVLSRPQFNKAVESAESVALADSAASLLKARSSLLEQIIAEQNGIIDKRTAGYVHYRDLWTETDNKLEDVEIRADKLKRSRWRWTLISAVVVGTAAFFVGKSAN